MGKGSIGAAEFERLVARTGNAKYLARPYTGRKDGMPVSECVRMAYENDRNIAAASGTMTGDDPMIVAFAAYRAGNALAARGRKAETYALLLSVPKDMPEEAVRPYMRKAYEVIELADVSVVRTDTAHMTAHVTAFGGAAFGEAETADGAESVPDFPDGEYRIILCGQAGAEETVLLYGQYRERLSAKYPKHFLSEIPALAEGLDAGKLCETGWKNGMVYAFACGDGGVYAGLFGLSERLRTGLSVSLPEIPISQKTIEVCEELNIDPYQIGSGGCILMITRDAEKLLSALYAEGAEAADIGCLQNGFAKELHNGDEVRCLEPYRG